MSLDAEETILDLEAKLRIAVKALEEITMGCGLGTDPNPSAYALSANLIANKALNKMTAHETISKDKKPSLHSGLVDPECICSQINARNCPVHQK